MKNFYVALIEVDTEKAEMPFADALNNLKTEGDKVGKVTYYQVKYEHQYRKAEHEFKEQVK